MNVMRFIDFVNANSGFFMVVITLVYVAATIGIFCANHRSAKAANQQLSETQTQFEETRRLECLPFLQLDFSSESPEDTVVFPPEKDIEKIPALDDKNGTKMSFKNVGNGTATNIIYAFTYNEGTKSESDSLIHSIMKGDTFYFLSFFPERIKKGTIELEFDDFLGNHYIQKFHIVFFDEHVREYEAAISDIENPVLCQKNQSKKRI